MNIENITSLFKPSEEKDKKKEIGESDDKPSNPNINASSEEKEWTKNFSKSFTKNFGMVKQWGLQKMGKAVPSPEKPEIKEMLNKYNHNKTELTEAANAAITLSNSLKILQKAQDQFATTIATLGGHQKVTAASSRRVQGFVDLFTVISAQTQQLSGSFDTLLLDPLKQSMEHVNQVENLKVKYNSCHLDHDSRENSVSDLSSKSPTDPNRQAAEEALREVSEEWELISDDLVKVCTDISINKEDLLFRQLGEYMSLYQTSQTQTEKTAKEILANTESEINNILTNNSTAII